MLQGKKTDGLRKFGIVGTLIMAMMIPACSKKSDQDDENADESTDPIAGGTTTDTLRVDEVIPADSTGVTADLTLDLASLSATDGFSLTDSATQIDIGEAIVLTTARLSVGGIKIKAGRERTQAELRLAAAEKLDRTALASEEESQRREMNDVRSRYRERIRTASEADALRLQGELEQEIIGASAARALKRQEGDRQTMALAQSRDASMKWGGPFVYDLIAQSLSTPISASPVRDGSYERIEFQLRPWRAGEGTDPLLNNVLYLEGTVLINGAPVKFQISDHAPTGIVLKGSNAFRVRAEEQNRLMMGFDVRAWFGEIDLTTATADEDGVIVIDQANNVDILTALRRNVRTCARFGQDADGNGSLADGEAAGDGHAAVDEDIE